ncbi:hypothetical protein HMPREF9004_1265 [Schaalia cardiffensis F0333]|uniref:Uncharacterized protein n=1 Tax=Schaalia cardiffensis F0333 TaxID=888050 RepID=N6XA24_9ACTO|nr:hypothetical protein HMPREF9004_1265 [Schaalia cardiffensis F0333]
MRDAPAVASILTILQALVAFRCPPHSFQSLTGPIRQRRTGPLRRMGHGWGKEDTLVPSAGHCPLRLLKVRKGAARAHANGPSTHITRKYTTRHP